MLNILNILLVFFMQLVLGDKIDFGGGAGWTWTNDRYSTDECIDDFQNLYFCYEIWDPVCGFDMVTYPSCCFARVSGIKYAVRGMECPNQKDAIQTQENQTQFDQNEDQALMRRLLTTSTRTLDTEQGIDFIPISSIMEIFPDVSITYSRNGRTMNRKMTNPEEIIIEDTQDNVIQTITEIIVGDEDTRVWVRDTTSAPFKYVGQLDVGCTGSLIGSRYVLTAAHCIISRWGQQFFDLNFTPGKNGDFEPFGTFEWFEAYVPQAWKETKNESADFAVIVYNERISDVLGGFFGIQPNCNQEQYILNIFGYPDDSRVKNLQYVSSCQEVQLKCDQDVIMHTCDTYRGMSGGPMITFRRDANPPFNIRTIHSGGNTLLEKNFAVNINPQILTEIQDYIEYAEQNLAQALDVLFMQN